MLCSRLSPAPYPARESRQPGSSFRSRADRLLHMRLEKPQRLVEITGNLSENVGGIGVTRLVCLVDRPANRVGDASVALDERM